MLKELKFGQINVTKLVRDNRVALKIASDACFMRKLSIGIDCHFVKARYSQETLSQNS